jgi:hypothetical protein
MASQTGGSNGHGTHGPHGLESAYTVPSAAPALELMLSISSSLWVTLPFPRWACVVSVCVLILNFRSPSTGFQSSIESSMPIQHNLLVRMTALVPGHADLSRVLVAEGVFMICR